MSVTLSMILEGVVAGLFVATIVYTVILNRRLNIWRRRANDTDTKPERLA